MRDCTYLPNSNMLEFYEFFFFEKWDTKVSSNICESPLVSLVMGIKAVEDRVPSWTGYSLMLRR